MDLERTVMPLLGQTIAHMVMNLEKMTLRHNALVTTHACSIVVIVPRIHMILLLMVFTHILSRDALIVHAFSVVVHVPLAQMVRYIELLSHPQIVWFSAGFPRLFSLTPALGPRPFPLVLCR